MSYLFLQYLTATLSTCPNIYLLPAWDPCHHTLSGVNWFCLHKCDHTLSLSHSLCCSSLLLHSGANYRSLWLVRMWWRGGANESTTGYFYIPQVRVLWFKCMHECVCHVKYQFMKLYLTHHLIHTSQICWTNTFLFVTFNRVWWKMWNGLMMASFSRISTSNSSIEQLPNSEIQVHLLTFYLLICCNLTWQYATLGQETACQWNQGLCVKTLRSHCDYNFSNPLS